MKSLVFKEDDKYELLRGTPGLRRKLAVSVKNPTSIPTPHSETEPRHVVTDSTLSLRVPCTENRNRTRNDETRYSRYIKTWEGMGGPGGGVRRDISFALRR